MSAQPIGTYRGCTLLLYPRDRPLYGNSCTPYLRYTIDRVKQDIDNYLGDAPPTPEPPPPEPPETDHIEETYRGVDIWWKVSIDAYWAQVATGYTAVAATLTEMRASIDEILEFLNPPEDPEEGLFAQVVAEVKTWVGGAITSALELFKPWVDNAIQIALGAIDWLITNVTNIIDNSISYIDNSIEYWGDQITQYIDNTVTYIDESRHYWGDQITQYIDNTVTSFNEYITNNNYNLIQNITNVVGVLDPLGFLKDPKGYITGVWNLLIDPWAHKMVKSFWEGLEAGLEE